jgi:hypothetical protein
MSRQDHVCPLMKKTCIGCSVYRGRHIGLWTSERPAHASKAPSNGKGSDWVDSLDAFLKDLARLEGTTADWD